jgi:biotin carboxyl carrier protein
MYSYVLLSFLMVITFHILRSFSPEWAFVPAAAIGAWVFRSRIKLLVNFMKMLYLDKKERVRAWFTPVRIAAVVTAMLLVFLLPLWPDFVQGEFLLFPGQSALIRATVPGTVAGVSVHEGDLVSPGAGLVRMRNLSLESGSAEAREKLTEATAQENKAVLHYADIAAAEQERQHQETNNKLANERAAQLALVSPISGIVVTPHVEDLVGRSLDEGDLVLQVDGTSDMKAEVYIPEFAMHDVHVGQKVRLLPNGQFWPVTGMLSRLSSVSATLPDGLLAKAQLQGINPPRYFVGTVWLKNDAAEEQSGTGNRLRPGAAGSAKVVIARRSIAGFCWRFGRELVDRKLW